MTTDADRTAARAARLGVVVIGRNEGERLTRCLASISGLGAPVAYADSASSDDSVGVAGRAGAIVVRLTPDAAPLNAARGRNAGLAALKEAAPETAFVQFIDGDCVIEDGWVGSAIGFLEQNPRVAAVCGRRREAHPSASLYNRLADEEWDTPTGPASECGGDSIMRVAALDQVGPFDPALTAGEEPELCSRLRAAGWTIWRLDAAMTVHDMAMTRLGQWMRRARRSGIGYAQAYSRTRSSGAPLYAANLRSAFAWALAIPLAAISIALWLREPAVLLAVPLLYALQIFRIAMRRGVGSLGSWQYGALMMVSKVPEAIGALGQFLSPTSRNPGGRVA